MTAHQALFEAVQADCERPVWSHGVRLARGDSVSLEEEQANELSMRVRTGRGLEAPLVTLAIDDCDWQCSCNRVEDPCEHVAACVIALRQAEKSGEPISRAGRERGRIVYRLEERKDELVLSRWIETESGRVPLPASLAAIAAGRVDAPDFVASPADMEIERHLQTRAHGTASSPVLTRVMGSLSKGLPVELDGQPIRVAEAPLGLVVRVVDAPGGVRVFAETDRRILRSYRNGVVRTAEALHPLAPNRLTGREMADLPRGRFFADDELATLVTELLPELEGRVEIDVETKKLPRTRRGQKPRLIVETHREGDGLRLLPTLVYGSPAVARVDAGRLVHLGQGEVPVRDRAAEDALAARLRSELGLRLGFGTTLPAEEALRFVDRLLAADVELRGSAHHDFSLRGALEPRLEIDGDRVQLDFSLSTEATNAGDGARSDGRASNEAVLRAFGRGESVVSLDGGGFARLPADWLERFGPQLTDLLGALDARGRVARHALPDLGRLCEALDHPPPPALEGLRPLLDEDGELPPAELDPSLEKVLRPYQREGVDWLVFLRGAELGGLLADDMGLGKTLQALCALEGRSLVVAPTSVLHGWLREIERFRPSLRAALYHGPARRLDAQAEVTVTSYALLRQDAAALARVEWDCVVLDEAQAIKNPESQVARAAFGLRAKARIALTGTPVENRLDELWSQLHFLNPGLLGGRSGFRERFSRPIEEGDGEAAGRLRARLRPFLKRRLKSKVAPELPPLTEIVLDCELSEAERAVYDGVRAATVREVVSQLRAGGNVMAALEALLRLRQAACHSSLVPGQPDRPDSSKLETLYARLEEAVADGHKALVFSQWTSLLDRVEPGLSDRGIDWLRLDGSVRDRGAVVEGFQAPEGPPLMLLSLKAGGTGLNLTAADHVFLLDPWWNPAVEAQAADRAHRIGQERPVVLHRLIALNTVEEGILALHARKRALADAALEGADGSTRLSRDELVELLENA